MGIPAYQHLRHRLAKDVHRKRRPPRKRSRIPGTSTSTAPARQSLAHQHLRHGLGKLPERDMDYAWMRAVLPVNGQRAPRSLRRRGPAWANRTTAARNADRCVNTLPVQPDVDPDSVPTHLPASPSPNPTRTRRTPARPPASTAACQRYYPPNHRPNRAVEPKTSDGGDPCTPRSTVRTPTAQPSGWEALDLTVCNLKVGGSRPLGSITVQATLGFANP